MYFHRKEETGEFISHFERMYLARAYATARSNLSVCLWIGKEEEDIAPTSRVPKD